MLQKQVRRAATIAQSPLNTCPDILAAGTVEGMLDDNFCSSSYLEFFDTSSENLNQKEMFVIGNVVSPVCFKKLSQGDKITSNIDRPKGLIAGGMADGSLTIQDPNLIIGKDDKNGLLSSINAPSSTSFFANSPSPIVAVEFNPCLPNIIASGSQYSEILIWDLENCSKPVPSCLNSKTSDIKNQSSNIGSSNTNAGTPTAQATASNIFLTALAQNPKVGNILATSNQNGQTSIQDLRQKRTLIVFPDSSHRKASTTSIAQNPFQARQIAVSYANSIAEIQDLRRAMSPRLVIENPVTDRNSSSANSNASILSVCQNPHDPDLLMTSSEDSNMVLQDANNGKQLSNFELQEGSNFEVCWSPIKKSLLAGSSFSGKVSIRSVQQTGVEHVPVQQSLKSSGCNFGFGGNLVHFSSEKFGEILEASNKVKSDDISFWKLEGNDEFIKEAKGLFDRLIISPRSDISEDKIKVMQNLSEFCSIKLQNTPKNCKIFKIWKFLQIIFETDLEKQTQLILKELGFGYTSKKNFKEPNLSPKSNQNPQISSDSFDNLSENSSSSNVEEENFSIQRKPNRRLSNTSSLDGEEFFEKIGRPTTTNVSETHTVDSICDLSNISPLKSHSENGEKGIEVFDLSNEQSVKIEKEISEEVDSRLDRCCKCESTEECDCKCKCCIELREVRDFNAKNGMATEQGLEIERALVVGDFQSAVDICLNENRMADALVIASCDPDLQRQTQQKFFEQHKSNFMKLTMSRIITNDLETLIKNFDLVSSFKQSEKDYEETDIEVSMSTKVGSQRQLLAVLLTYGEDRAQTLELVRKLGDRLWNLYKQTVVKENANDILTASTICWILSMNVEKIIDQIDLIVLNLQFNQTSNSSFLKLQSVIEILLVFVFCVQNFENKTENIETKYFTQDTLLRLCHKYFNYVEVLASQGRTDLALTFARFVIDFQSLKVDDKCNFLLHKLYETCTNKNVEVDQQFKYAPKSIDLPILCENLSEKNSHFEQPSKRSNQSTESSQRNGYIRNTNFSSQTQYRSQMQQSNIPPSNSQNINQQISQPQSQQNIPTSYRQQRNILQPRQNLAKPAFLKQQNQLQRAQRHQPFTSYSQQPSGQIRFPPRNRGNGMDTNTNRQFLSQPISRRPQMQDIPSRPLAAPLEQHRSYLNRSRQLNEPVMRQSPQVLPRSQPQPQPQLLQSTHRLQQTPSSFSGPGSISGSPISNISSRSQPTPVQKLASIQERSQTPIPSNQNSESNAFKPIQNIQSTSTTSNIKNDGSKVLSNINSVVEQLSLSNLNQTDTRRLASIRKRIEILVDKLQTSDINANTIILLTEFISYIMQRDFVQAKKKHQQMITCEWNENNIRWLPGMATLLSMSKQHLN